MLLEPGNEEHDAVPVPLAVGDPVIEDADQDQGRGVTAESPVHASTGHLPVGLGGVDQLVAGDVAPQLVGREVGAGIVGPEREDARVSTRNKNQDPELHLVPMREYAARRGWAVVDEYGD